MRLIDSDSLIERNKELADCEFDHPKYQETLRDLVEAEPTIDAVEVVRCKNCRYPVIDPDFPGNYMCKYHGSVWEDHFCSYGEMK